jgi:curved DNA-binding protein
MSFSGDPYAVLGVAPDATEKDIRTAFRSRAKACHPDVAGDDPAKAEEFKKLRAAYELLADPARRAAWDRRQQRRAGNGSPFYGNHWRNAGKPAGAQAGGTPSNQDLDLEDIFNDFGGLDFGFGKKTGAAPGAGSGAPSGPTAPPRPPTASPRVHVQEVKAAGRSSAVGPTSSTDGWHKASRPRPERRVEPEQGGDVRMRVDVPADVALRGGLVEVRYARLRRTDDGSIQNVDDLHELRVPPGVREGEELRVPKHGHAGDGGGPYGDLVATVHLVAARSPVEAPPGATAGPRMRMPQSPAPTAEVRPGGAGGEEVVSLDVRVTEAILGGRVTLETPQGAVRLSIPPGTSSGTRFRLRGRGKPGADGRAGDLYAEVRIVVPQQLDDESRVLIERFAELNPD